MAWNQPGNNGQDRDPWGSSKPSGNSEGNGNKGGRDQGPPDLDDIFRKLSKKLGGLGGGKGTGSGGGSSSQGPRPQLGGRVVTMQRQRLSLSGRPVVSIPLKKPNVAW